MNTTANQKPVDNPQADQPDDEGKNNKEDSLDVIQSPLKAQQGEPDFGVELEKDNKEESKSDVPVEKPSEEENAVIEVRQYDDDSRFRGELEEEELPVQNVNPDQVLPSYKPTIPPVKQLNTVKPLITISVIALVLLVGGFGGGFFGYRSGSNFFKKQTATADIALTTQTQEKDENVSSNKEGGQIQDKETSNSDLNSLIANWSIYSNTKYKYSVKYPDTWFGQGVNNPQSETVQLTSFKPDETGSGILPGYKVEIVFQASQGKTVKDWIESNNTIIGTTAGAITEIKIDKQDAYQQTATAPLKSISTYIGRNDSKIMIISYYAPEDKFTEGKTIYNQILETIKLM